MCDFSGFREPEMVKPRPVIVISPRLPHRSDIVAIVPISLTEPRHTLPFCFRLSKNYHPDESDDLPCWAKADMLLNLGLYRMSWDSRSAAESGNFRFSLQPTSLA